MGEGVKEQVVQLEQERVPVCRTWWRLMMVKRGGGASSLTVVDSYRGCW